MADDREHDLDGSTEPAEPAAPGPSHVGATPGETGAIAPVVVTPAEERTTPRARGAHRAAPAGTWSAGRSAARFLWGAVAVAVVSTTVWAVTTLPLPTSSVTPPVEVLTPTAADQERICPGPLVALGTVAAAPSDAGLLGTAKVGVAGTDDVEVRALTSIATAPPAAPSTTQASGPASFTAPGVVDDVPTSLAVAQTVQVQGATGTGFAATACSAPMGDQWIVGAATTTGRSAQLSLVNPSDVTAVVQAEVHTERGVVPTPSLIDMEIPAGSQRVVSLEGVAPDSPGFAVHVTSQGGPIAASISEVAMQGLTSLGVEIVGATAAPATRLDVVGVPFTSTAAESDEALFSERGAIIRTLVPGSTPAEVTVNVRALDGTPLEPIEATLQPGIVTDVPLSGYPVGRYTVTVESDEPVVGAVRSSTVGAQVDSAWYPASPSLDGAQVVAVPDGPTPRLHLANPGTAATTATVRLGSGDEQTIEIAPGSTWQSDVRGGSTVSLDGLEGVVASVTYDGPGQLAGMPVLPVNPLAQDVAVYR